MCAEKSQPTPNSDPLDCVDAFAILRRIMRPECIEDIYNPVDGADGGCLDEIMGWGLPDPEAEGSIFRDEGEPLEFDEVYVGTEEFLQLAENVTTFGG